MKKTAWYLLNLMMLAMLLFSACRESPMQPPMVDEVQIRIQNISTLAFQDVLVVFPNDSVAYGDIAAGAFSRYQKTSLAYRYAYIKLFAENREYVLQPIDYFGETPLDDGNYTYEMNILGEGKFDLSLALIKD